MKDTKLIEQVNLAKQGNADSFMELINNYMKDLYRAAYAILMNDSDVADAIQDTILACWEKLPSLKKPEYFKTWLIRILINKCYDLRKERARTTSLEAYDMPKTEDFTNVEYHEMLSCLSEEYRIPIVLYYEFGYRITEIASILHIPRSTIQRRIANGRKQLYDNYFSNPKEDSHE